MNLIFKNKIDEILYKIKSNDLNSAKKLSLKLIKKNKKDFQLQNIYATILYNLKEFNQAIEIYKLALNLNPNFYQAQYNLAKLYCDLKNYEKANIELQKCLNLEPNSIEVLLLLGNLNLKFKKYQLAEKNYLSILDKNPKDFRGYYSLGNLFKKKQQFEEAIKYYNKAIYINSKDFASYNNLANIYQEQGQYRLAINNYKKAIEINPRLLSTYSNYIYSLNFFEHFNYNEFLEVIKKFKKNIPKLKFNFNQNIKKNNLNKKINIGFVSGDFGIHPVSFFLIDLIDKINKKKFNLFAYSNSERNDSMTNELKKKFSSWIQVNNMNDETLIKIIKKDNIDILFDLSGHTGHNRLSIFVNRAAPIQITWLGYNASTGLSEIDYIIVDPHVISDKEKKLFSEKLLFMPETFQNIKIKENVKILCKNENKKDVIFGCFNRFSKINDEVIKIWSKILGTNKSAKIFLKSKEFSDIYFKKKIIQKFKHYKINEEQIILDGKEYSRNEFLHLYNKIDIMLDTFPYSGITTSIEGIWMGVPLLTLVGERYYSRIGYSINRNLNLNDWNVFNKDDYVKTALDKSNNYKDLIKLKASLRNKIEASPIFNSDTFARNFEDLLLKIHN